jgi:predicted aspartyl protease
MRNEERGIKCLWGFIVLGFYSIKKNKEKTMGHVNTQITLKNVRDIHKAEDGIIKEPEIRKATVDVMVDTGATMLVINEQLFQQLGIRGAEEREISLANDSSNLRFAQTCKLTEPLEIHWENRSISMPALVLEDASEFLLGSFSVRAQKNVANLLSLSETWANYFEDIF